MRKKILFLLSLITLQLGAIQPELCHVQLSVGPDNNQKAVLLNNAFTQVALKISGQTAVANAPELKNQSEQDLLKLVKSYTYKFQDEQQIFDVTFDYLAVKKKLNNYGFAVLPDNRPYTLVWLAVLDQDNQPTILSSDSSSPLKQAIDGKASDFGLPIIFPLLDFADTTAIEAQDVIDVHKGVLEAVSKKYSAQNIVAGKLVFAEGLWNASFTLLNYPDAQWSITSDSIDKIAAILFNNLSVALIRGFEPHTNKENALPFKASDPKSKEEQFGSQASHNLQEKAHLPLLAQPVPKEPEVEEKASVKKETKNIRQLSLHVEGVNDLDKYATIMSYLRRLDGVHEVEVAELGENSVSFNIESMISIKDLSGTITKDNFLRASATSSEKDNEMRFILSS